MALSCHASSNWTGTFKWSSRTILLAMVIMMLKVNNSVHAVLCDHHGDKEVWTNQDDKDWMEFVNFCQDLTKQRSSKHADAELANEIACADDVFDIKNLRMLFVLILIIGYGALVRTILRKYNIGIPYTVVLMLSGLLVGLFSRNFCDTLHTYTAIARIPPKIILFVFLPVLIFESAFSITPHIFVRSIVQILTVALPGMLFSTFATALVATQLLSDYKWGFLESSLFGSIISATDPVAVVSILRELGTSEILSVMIEGESLLNDGVAILLYEIFEKILTCHVPQDVHIALFVFGKFCQITLGGPIFGYFMGKFFVFCLSRVFNDATVEITITLVSAYLTYYIGEDILNVSGVMAVVVLGITMGSERTSISPEVETFVHHFWEMLNYLANTVLFVVVGIVITETALNKIELKDYAYLLMLYFMLIIIRFLMLLILFPIVSRIGYGLTWQSMIIMMWGGLRGAVGLCLALDIFDNKHLCDTGLGAKFLFQTAGIVFLTLVVNGTTTKKLLDILKLTQVSSGRIQDMANAMKQLEIAQLRTVSMLKHDRFIADANWFMVEKFTKFINPYLKKKHVKDKITSGDRLSRLSIKQTYPEHQTECPNCQMLVQNEPTTAEFMEMTEEARLRVLKALKVSFWRQFEKGILMEFAVLVLVNVAADAEDKSLRLVEMKDLTKYWKLRGFLPWMKTKFIKTCGLAKEDLPQRPTNRCRSGLWWLATREWFDYVIIAIIIGNMIPAIWETVIDFRCLKKPHPSQRKACDDDHYLQFLISSLIFNLIYLTEVIIKLVGRGPRDYFCTHKWNWLDLILLLCGCADIGITMSTMDNVPSVFAVLKIIRVGRAFRLLRPVVPRIMRIVDRRINAKLFLGYDVGKGFVAAVDDVLKYLPQMVSHPRILDKLERSLEHERRATVLQMGIMQKEHPGIAIAVKTRQASRAVLNQMRDALIELKEDGLVDEKECDLLLVRLEEKMKRLWDSPPSIPPAPPESLLGNVSWLTGNAELYDFVHSKAELISFISTDTICQSGDPPNGIFIITSGMVKIHYVPTDEILKNLREEGEIPNMELYLDLTFGTKEDDFFSTGTVIGEKSVLTGQRRAAAVTCETSVLAYHLSQSVMQEALKQFNDAIDSLESRMWRAVGMKIALAFLPKHPAYATWGMDKIRLHVERSCVPIGEKFNVIVVPNFVSQILVIQGKVKDAFSDQIFVAPSLVPRSVSKIILNPDKIGKNNHKIQARVLVIASQAMEDVTDQESFISLQQCLEAVIESHGHGPRTMMNVPLSLKRGSKIPFENNRKYSPNPSKRAQGKTRFVDNLAQ